MTAQGNPAMMWTEFTRAEAARIAFNVAVECTNRKAVEKLLAQADGNVAEAATACSSGTGRNWSGAYGAHGSETTDSGQTENQLED